MSVAKLDGFTERSIGRLLIETVSRYLENHEHRREFEDWYRQKYNKEYEWRK